MKTDARNAAQANFITLYIGSRIMLLNTDITVSQLLHYMNGIIQIHPEKEIFEIVDPKVFKSKKLDECDTVYDLCDQG